MDLDMSNDEFPFMDFNFLARIQDLEFEFSALRESRFSFGRAFVDDQNMPFFDGFLESLRSGRDIRSLIARNGDTFVIRRGRAIHERRSRNPRTGERRNREE